MLDKKCPYFGKCGGCVWQDLTEQEYIAKKESFIRRSFQDVNLSVDLSPLILIPTGTRRRVCLAFHKTHLGFNKAKTHEIVDINSCPLLTEGLNKTIPQIQKILPQLNSSGDIFLLDTPLGTDIHIKDKSTNLSLERLEILNQLAAFDSIVRLIYNDNPIFEKASLPDTADNFMQPSIEGEHTLIQLVTNCIKNEKTALDLFCGKGTFTIPLIEKGLKAMGYDCSDGVLNLGPNGIQRDLFRNPLTPTELKNIDLIVLDPPRSGALAQTQQIALSQVPTIVMISCNPKTAARDVKILTEAGWQIQTITPVDQFTYSNHVEIVVLLKK